MYKVHLYRVIEYSKDSIKWIISWSNYEIILNKFENNFLGVRGEVSPCDLWSDGKPVLIFHHYVSRGGSGLVILMVHKLFL